MPGLLKRQDRLLERRLKHAGFRDAGKTLDTFEFDFNKKMHRALVFELATRRFITQREDGLFLGRPLAGFQVSTEGLCYLGAILGRLGFRRRRALSAGAARIDCQANPLSEHLGIGLVEHAGVVARHLDALQRSG